MGEGLMMGCAPYFSTGSTCKPASVISVFYFTQAWIQPNVQAYRERTGSGLDEAYIILYACIGYICCMMAVYPYHKHTNVLCCRGTTMQSSPVIKGT